MASIDQLKGLISQKGGLAKPNVFRVLLPSLPGASNSEVNLLCKDVTIPGRQILSRERQIGLTTQKMAYGYAVEDVSMTFLVLNDYGIRQYFETWQNLAVNQTSFEIGYKDEYCQRVVIQQLKRGFGLPVYSTPLGLPKLPTIIQNRLPQIGPFDLARGQLDLDFITGDQVIYSCELIDAYPTTLNALPLNNELDGLLELNVQLSYKNWVSTATPTSPARDLGNTVLGTIATRLFN